MKEMIEFSLDLYKTGKYDVETRTGQPAEIKFTDGRKPCPIVGYVGKSMDNGWLFAWDSAGHYEDGAHCDYDLFLVEKEQTEEQTEEINEALVWAAIKATCAWRRKTDFGYEFYSEFINEKGDRTTLNGEGSTPYAAAVELYKKLKGE